MGAKRLPQFQPDWRTLSINDQVMDSLYPRIFIPSSGCMHYSLSSPFPKCFIELGPVMYCEIVSHKRLAAIFIYPLEDL